MQHGVVQHHHTRAFQRAAVDSGMQRIVAEMVERRVAAVRSDLHPAVPPQSFEQRRRVIRHAGVLGRQRRIEPDGHAFFRLPNSAVPTRCTSSPLRWPSPDRATFPSRAAEGRAAGRAPAGGGSKDARPPDRPTTAASSSAPAGAGWDTREPPRSAPRSAAGSAPLLASSPESFTSSMTSSGWPHSLSRRASFGESTVWITWNSSAAFRDLFDCRWPIRWKRAPARSATSGALPSNSCT